MTGGEGLAAVKMEKQKDAEAIDQMNFEMLPITLVEGSSAVLVPTEYKPKVKHQNRLSGAQKLALKSLRNLCADRGQKVTVSSWHAAHARDCPDTPKSTASTARNKLVEDGFVIIAEGLCWINKELDE